MLCYVMLRSAPLYFSVSQANLSQVVVPGVYTSYWKGGVVRWLEEADWVAGDIGSTLPDLAEECV